jgi:acetyl esterase
MALDPVVAAFLAQLEAAGMPPLNEQTIEQAREGMDLLAPLGGEGAEVGSVEERQIAGVRSIVYTPLGVGPFPVLVFMHGGGWLIGGPQHYHGVSRDLAAGAGCIVVSVDYRLAPEHKAPAAVDDCRAVTGWVLDHAAELGGDPDRVAVGGDSAGGNLSALMAQAFGHRLVFQLLVYPVTDLSMTSPSITENADGYFLTKDAMDWFVGHYIDGSGVDRNDPSVAPLHAADAVVGSVAPALVITAQYDPLRDEGEAYGERMRSLGVDVTMRRFPGQVHGFYGFREAMPAAAMAIDQSAAMLRAAFGG